jgi:hypothetical protein
MSFESSGAHFSCKFCDVVSARKNVPQRPLRHMCEAGRDDIIAAGRFSGRQAR